MLWLLVASMSPASCSLSKSATMLSSAKRAVRKTLVRAGYHATPSFIIIGAQKSGTRGLYETLSQHPQLRPSLSKELHFFDDGRIDYGDFNSYHRAFPLPFQLYPNKLTFEATPSYLYDYRCPERIHHYNPSLLLVAVLREPVSRAYSAWNMCRRWVDSKNHKLRSAAEHRTFEDAVSEELEKIDSTDWTNNMYSYVSRGFYIEQIERYLKYFNRDSLLIFEHGQLLSDPHQCLATICRQLSIDEDFEFEVRRANVSTYKSSIEPPTANRLADIYRSYNERLFSFMGEEYDW